MHLRFSVWMALFAFVAAGTLRAQAPASTAPAAAAAMPPGQIVAAKVTGEVSMVLNGATSALHDRDAVSQSATIVTGKDSSVILVFSNGATTQLGADTSLVIEEFLQDPFKDSVRIADLKEEPTRSHTKLHLTKGELIGQVKHLHQDQGSTFTVETPVGAAGIRGTTFRIIFRPSGTGAAFAIFSVSTLEGVVAFSAAGQGQPGTQSQQTASQTRSRGGSVAVTTGREVVVTVSVDTDPVTGQVVVTAPIQLATTTPLNPVVRATLVSQATTMATTIEESGTTFTSDGTTSGGTSSGSSSSSSSSSSTDSTDKGGTSGGSTDNSGGQSSSGQSSGSSSTGTASTLTSSIAGGRQINTSPGFTSQVQDLTPGAGS